MLVWQGVYGRGGSVSRLLRLLFVGDIDPLSLDLEGVVAMAVVGAGSVMSAVVDCSVTLSACVEWSSLIFKDRQRKISMQSLV